MFLLDDLLLAPFKGVMFIAEKIHEAADREMNDETVVKQELLELQSRLEAGEISLEEYAPREAEIFARLRAIKAGQMERMQQLHTSESSSFVVETGRTDTRR